MTIRTLCDMGILAVAVSTVLVLAGALPATVSANAAESGEPAPATIGPACAAWSQNAVAIGSPRRTVAGVPQAGVVELHYRTWSAWEVTTVTSAMLGLPLQANGWFGASLSLFSDPKSDCLGLVIGMPGANKARGSVVLLRDLGNGFDPAASVLLPTESLSLRPGDRLGTSVESTEWMGEGIGWQRIAAGAPGRDAPDAPDAGALFSWRIPDPAAGVESPSSFDPPDTFAQGIGGLQGHAEPNDRFGSVLHMAFDSDDGDFFVGIPDEDIGARKDAGAVALLRFGKDGALESNELLWQGSGLPGESRAGDRAGAALYYRHIGVPGKDADGRKDSGAVLIWNEAKSRYQVITQNSKGVPGVSETGDAFGSALGGRLHVGVPGEDVKGRRDVGAVTVLGYRFLTERKGFTHPSPSLRAGDRFGSSLLFQDHSCGEDVYCSITLIGAPGYDQATARDTGAYFGSFLRDESDDSTPTVFTRGISADERFGALPMNTYAEPL